MSDITGSDGWFLDGAGRRLILRGLNVGGSSKVPSRPDGSTHLSAGFFNHRAVSFVGRPFDPREADDHFRRIRDWGFGFVRLVVTWEALEHQGPGLYDESYLDYLGEVVEAAARHRVDIVVDPHQDAWSRFSGGDGAPGWTLEAAGFDLTGLHPTGAAVLQQFHRATLPHMIWPTNMTKLAAATMFTLFFGGSDFAPRLTIEGTSAERFLQDHFLAAYRRLATRLRPFPNILGFDCPNEPSPGFIGCQGLDGRPAEPRIGAMPTPLQSMALGDGLPQRVESFRFGPLGSCRTGHLLVNLQGLRAWSPGRECPWRLHGVWERGTDGSARLLEPDYFTRLSGREVDFTRDYLTPFLARFGETIRAELPDALLFAQPTPGGPIPRIDDPSRSGEALRLAGSPHWYDGIVLMRGRYNRHLGADARRMKPIFGASRIRRRYAQQLREFQNETAQALAGAPTLFGEVGVPFSRAAGGPNRGATDAMNRSLTAMDDALASYALWNYTADNDPELGDRWNGEDFSVFGAWCRDRRSGEPGRALSAVIRPRAVATVGTPLRQFFDPATGRFEFRFRSDPAIKAATEVYLPRYHYGDGFTADTSPGRWQVDAEEQILRFFASGDRPAEHYLLIRPVPKS